MTIFLLFGALKGYPIDRKILAKDQLLSIILKYHPVVRQTDLIVERAKAQLLQSRGSFDPTLNIDLDRKTFGGQQYFNYFNPQISIPTWYGFDIKAGFEEISGDRVSSESSIGQTSYLGVKLSANSLLFDSRRATLRQAQLFCKQSEAEKRSIVNNILYDALTAYWSWVKEYQNYNIVSHIVNVCEERLRFVRVEFNQGARPAIDTTETLAQLQAFYVQQQDALVAVKNAGITLSCFMWEQGNMPFGWDEGIIPDSNDMAIEIETPSLGAMLETLSTHPKFEAVNYKINSLQIDQKLKAQYLIPKLSINANVLSKGYYESLPLQQTQLENNHKLGATLNIPLLYRDALGSYRSSKLKVLEVQAEQSNLAMQLEIKVRSYYNELQSLRDQVRTFSLALDNYKKMYNAEKFRFNNGESSLFILNSRENKLLEASQKLVELKTKMHKSYAGMLWASGKLF